MNTFTEPTNKERAERIPLTLDAFVKARGDGRDSDETDITDLLTDLQHYAKREALDFAGMLTMSEVNFNSEIEEEV